MPEPDIAPKRSYVFVRGVGDAAPNAALIEAGPRLEERDDVATTVEANWSFGSAPALQPTVEAGHRGVWQPPLLLEHVENLARSWRGCAVDSRPPHPALDRAGDHLIQLGTLSTASIVPFLVGLLPGLGWMSRAAAVWWSICVVSATLGAMLRCKWVGVAAAIRIWFFALTWPIMLALLLPGLAPPALVIGLPAGVIAFAAMLRAPASWIHTAQSGIQTPSIVWYLFLILSAMAVSVLTSIAAWPIAVAIRSTIAPVAKRVADVVRYRGGGEYRDHIHADVRTEVCALDRSTRLVLCAHSLGSVIAVDFIRRHRGLIEEFAGIDLVTGGSPLRRFMARFFPHAYPKPNELLHAILGAHAGFRWVHLYRRWDPIGSSLGLPRGLDRRADDQTWPPRLGFRAHANFWGDSTVWHEAARGMERWEADPPSPHTSPEPFVDPGRSPSTAHGTVVRGVALLALLIASVTGTHWITYGEVQQAIKHAARLKNESGTAVVRGEIHKYTSFAGVEARAPTTGYRLTYSIGGVDYERRGWPLSSSRGWLDSEVKWTDSNPLTIGLARGVAVSSAPINIRYVVAQPSVWGVDGWLRGPKSTAEHITTAVGFALLSVIAVFVVLFAWEHIGSNFYGALIGEKGGTHLNGAPDR